VVAVSEKVMGVAANAGFRAQSEEQNDAGTIEHAAMNVARTKIRTQNAGNNLERVMTDG
jgi:hypothetical protein